jgi:hypothetical protein
LFFLSPFHWFSCLSLSGSWLTNRKKHCCIRESGTTWKDWQEEVVVHENQTAGVRPCLLPPNGCFRDSFQDGNTDGWELDAGWQNQKPGWKLFLSLEEKAQANVDDIEVISEECP